jgi:SsrA-binding protein
MYLVKNRQATFNYEIIEEFTAGIILLGSEVKSIRLNGINLSNSFCYINNNEIFIKNAIITSKNVFFEHDENRDKKLLLKKSEIKKLHKNLDKGMTIIPLGISVDKNNRLKCVIALAKGKKMFDKREAIKSRDLSREFGKLVKV